MSDIAVRVQGLGKQYRIGERHRTYKTIRESISTVAMAPFHAIRSLAGRHERRPEEESTIWALKDVSFEVNAGEVVGVIGPNGAGKTTLLKILSRITEPATGRIELHGRVGSLLEVGTGFHPELTGRENVYLSGAILGMKRTEINRKFDEIVAFAETEKFLDTPVKRYSSGMRMRLAFAVAAHLDPEILLVDEILAVGDAEFQKRCTRKMGDVAELGRTVLFVSHQMNQIRRLCTRVLWIEKGQIQRDGTTSSVVSEYEARFRSPQSSAAPDLSSNDNVASFLGWELVNAANEDVHSLTHFGELTVRLWLRIPHPIRDWHHGISLLNQEGHLIWGAAASGLYLEKGLYAVDYCLPSLPLKPGLYEWLASIWESGRLLHMWSGIPLLHVVTLPVTHPSDAWSGILNLPFNLTMQNVEVVGAREHPRTMCG